MIRGMSLFGPCELLARRRCVQQMRVLPASFARFRKATEFLYAMNDLLTPQS
jgi:hypothetical protein